MAKIEWDKTGERLFETGVDRGVLYPYSEGAYQAGVPWNGLTGITESPSGAENTDLYADNIKYLTMRSAEDFGLTIECYMYPDEFKPCNGETEIAEGVTIGQQARGTFGLSYRTLIGNDTMGTSYGYKLHLVYGCSVSPSEVTRSTVNDSPEAGTFSYETTTTPVNISEGNAKPTAMLVIDSTKANKEKLAALEDLLWGTEDDDAKLPTPDEVIALFKAAA